MLAIRKAKSLFTVVLTIAIAFATCHAFAVDAYIESDGTSGIDTGYRMKPNSRLEVDFAVLDGIANTARIFGADYSTTALKTACSLYVSGTYFVFGVGNSAGGWKTVWMKDSSGNYIVCDTQRHKAVIDFNGGNPREDRGDRRGGRERRDGKERIIGVRS